MRKYQFYAQLLLLIFGFLVAYRRMVAHRAHCVWRQLSLPVELTNLRITTLLASRRYCLQKVGAVEHLDRHKT